MMYYSTVDIDTPKSDILTPEEVAQYLRKSLSWVYKNWQILGGRKLRGSLFFPNCTMFFPYRYSQRDRSKPWVFWHTYTSSKSGEKQEGQYQDRKKVMRGLCQKAGVKYFRFHALRHAGASIMERRNVPIGSIQRILGHEKRTTTEIYLHCIAGHGDYLFNPFSQ